MSPELAGKYLPDGDGLLALRRQFLARVDRYLSDGPPRSDERLIRRQIRERYGV